MKHITREMLGRILFEEFERDEWGLTDPYHFKYAAQEADDASELDENDDEVESLRKVFNRTVSRLNEEINGK